MNDTNTSQQAAIVFADQFQTLTGFEPMRWQQRLYDEHFANSTLPSAVSVCAALLAAGHATRPISCETELIRTQLADLGCHYRSRLRATCVPADHSGWPTKRLKTEWYPNRFGYRHRITLSQISGIEGIR